MVNRNTAMFPAALSIVNICGDSKLPTLSNSFAERIYKQQVDHL